jgi:hypothetical protein
MNIFFDMDYTIISSTGTLRPKAKAVLERLHAEGHKLYIWSGRGPRRKEVQDLNLNSLVTDILEKPTHDYQLLVRGMFRRGELSVLPDVVIDDYPEVVSALGGISVRPYVIDDPSDNEMQMVYEAIQQIVQRGTTLICNSSSAAENL